MDLMPLEELLAYLDAGNALRAGTREYETMAHYSEEARKVLADINSGYRTPAELRMLMAELTGRPVPATFRLFPPFYSDFGKNIHLGERVFINSCCCFQDQGGIYIGDGTFLGHQVTVATINHGLEPADRFTNYVARTTIGKNVWIGSGAILLPGITVGDNAVVGAGAVVTKDVAENTVVVGNPAHYVKRVP